jgi:fructose-1,6-bisphosphatase I
MKTQSLSEFQSLRVDGADPVASQTAQIVTEVAEVGKRIFRQVQRAGLESLYGETGAVNVQGEEVKKLDELANEYYVTHFRDSKSVGSVVSEEMDSREIMTSDSPAGEFLLTLDPLDGSSNIDVNVTIGTIFGLYHRAGTGFGVQDVDMPHGDEMIACGYVLYGAACYLVYWQRGGVVCAFDLDSDNGEFFLTDENIRIPEQSAIYSVNEANYSKWDNPTRKAVDFLRTGREKSSTRYIGSLVADFHRNLYKGGVYLYPAEIEKPDGKIRLLYEAAPLGKLATEAGGLASTGRERILEITPDVPHQRCPTIIGSKEVVKQIEKFYESE